MRGFDRALAPVATRAVARVRRKGSEEPRPRSRITEVEFYNAMGIVLLVLLVLLLVGGLPRWQHSRSWGYGPSGAIGAVLAVVALLVIVGYIPRGF